MVGVLPGLGDFAAGSLRALKNEANNFEVLTSAPAKGATRNSHRAGANRHLAEQLKSDPIFKDWLDKELGVDVLAHMRSGKSDLLNPPGTEWHHPNFDPDALWLLRNEVHRDSDLQGILHGGGTGGFADHYRGN
jgi:hypothetical protein